MKIAMIVQRYGAEVNGGAEVHARIVAEKLQLSHDITVITSCALDYHTWTPVFAEGESVENGTKIIRLPNKKKDPKGQDLAYKKIKKMPFFYFRYKVFKWFKFWIPFNKSTNFADAKNISWLKAQGPEMPTLLDYLKSHIDNFDVFIFFTSIYYPAALGIMTAAPKSILVPQLHPEAATFFPIYQKVMRSAQWIFYNTLSEKKFSETIFPVKATKNAIVAVGIDLPAKAADTSTVLKKFNITKPYLIYVGRIDRAKNCEEMIQYFLKYISETKAELQLVLVGKSTLNLSAHAAIVSTGFINDVEKTALMQQASALIMPSRFESLSLVLLESFACQVPVIANGNTEVLKDHILQSDGGWCYTSYSGFKTGVHEVFNHPENARKRGEKGFEYVRVNYSWPAVIKKYEIAFEDIRQQHLGR